MCHDQWIVLIIQQSPRSFNDIFLKMTHVHYYKKHINDRRTTNCNGIHIHINRPLSERHLFDIILLPLE